MNCTSTNLVYVITCAGCGQNYIGETGDVLRNRVTVHKQQIRDPDTRTLGVSARPGPWTGLTASGWVAAFFQNHREGEGGVSSPCFLPIELSSWSGRLTLF